MKHAPLTRRQPAVPPKTVAAPRRLARPTSAASALEQRAQVAADRVMRGDVVGHQLLGDAPPARATVTGSPGAPLPPELRARLERGFDADLGAVRLHVDSAAAAAAQGRHARGFAAGPEVFVDLRPDAVSSDRGRHLIAHEVAHVLQQTGRRGPHGRLRATDVTGSGDVQCADDAFVQGLDDAGLFSATPTWDQLTAAYAGVADITAHVALVGGAVGFALPTSAAAARAAAALPDDAAFGALADDLKAFYVDALKAVGREETFEAAWKILDTTRALPTAFRSRAFYQWLRDKTLDWLVQQVAASAFLKEYLPGNYLYVWRSFFFGPNRGLQELDLVAEKGPPLDFADKAAAELKRITEVTPRGPNELATATTLAVAVLDRARWALQRGLLTYAKDQDQTANAVGQRRIIAQRVAAEDEKALTFGPDLPEPAHLFAYYFPRVKRMAAAALRHWRRAESAWTLDVLPDVGSQELVDLRAAVGQAFPGLGRFLVESATRILGGDLPAASTLAAKVADERKAFVKHGNSYDVRLLELVREGKDKSQEALQLGVVTHALAWLADQLVIRDPGGDDDQRLGVRIEYADALYLFARIFGLSAVEQKVKDLFGFEGRVVFYGDWEPRAATVGDFQDDIASLRTTLPLGLTSHLIERYHFAHYYRELASQLQVVTGRRGMSYAPSSTSILGEALDAVKGVGRPERWVMTNYSAWYRPAMAFGKSRSNVTPVLESKLFHNLVFDHPRTERLLRAQEATADPALPRERFAVSRIHAPQDGGPIVIWLLSRIDELVTELRAIDGLDALVSGEYQRLHGAKPATTLRWDLWLGLLAAVADELSEAQQAAIVGIPEAEFAGAQQAAFDEMRRAIIHQRRVESESSIIPDLKAHQRGSRDLRSAKAAFDAYRRFAVFADVDHGPVEEASGHVAALVLETSEAFIAAFGADDEREVVGQALPLAKGAVAIWKDARGARVLKVARSDWDAAAYADAATKLEAKAAELEAPALAWQKQVSGLVVDQATRSVSLTGYPISLKEGESFDIFGITFIIGPIARSFRFHRQLRQYVPFPAATPPIHHAGNALLLDEHGGVLEPKHDLLMKFVRVEDGNARPVEVYDDSIEALDDLAFHLGERAGLSLIMAVGDFLESVTEVFLTVVSFIPGVGQAVDAGMFIISFLDFLTSDEFKVIMKALGDEGLAAIPRVFESFTSALEPAELLNALLFRADFESRPTVKSPPAPSQRAAKTSLWGKVAGTLANVFRIGDRLLERLERLAKKAQFPVRAAQMWVLSHPGVALTLDLVTSFAGRLGDLGIDELLDPDEAGDAGFVEAFTRAVAGATNDFVTTVQEMLGVLAHLELPSTIVDMSLIVDFLLELFVEILPAKYEFVAGGVIKLLRAAGLWDDITDAIADALGGVGADPNIFWQEQIRQWIEPELQDAREWFLLSLMELLRQVPFLSSLTDPAAPPLEVKFGGEEFPEAESYPSVAGDRPLPFMPGPLPAPSGGEPLAPPARARAESVLGHDLSHVRLHGGADGARVTGAFAAEGITTGSHVYLRPGASRHVLHHELAHVVQQTGPRPLGTPASRQPAVGEPGLGVRWEAGRESAAEQTAARLDAGGPRAAAPLDVGGAARGGQPAIDGSELLTKFLAHMTSTADLVARRDEIAREAASAPRDLVGDSQGTAIRDALEAQLLDVLKKMTLVEPWKHLRSELATYLTAIKDRLMRGIDVEVVAARTHVPASDKSRPDVPYVAPGDLELELERYLFADAALAVDLEVAARKDKEQIGRARREVVDTTKVVATAKLAYVHLPLTGAEGEPLWDALVTNTFSTAVGSEDHKSYKAGTKLVVGRDATPRPQLYATGAPFRLDTAAKEKAGKLAKRVERVVTAARGAWPSPRDYADPDGAGDLGLRLGTYGQWGPGTHSGVVERDAHHTTQWLLVEYFANSKSSNDRKPFPLLTAARKLYPGVDAAGKLVSTIKSTAGATINVGAFYDTSRGLKMPTIYIARFTHQSNIHYRAEPPDEGEGDTLSQSATVQNEFTERMGGLAPLLKDQEALEELRDAKKTHAEKVQQRDLLQDRIYTAARGCYDHMRNEMMGKLERGLKQQEVRYYNAVAERQGLTDLLTAAMVQTALDRAKDRNETEFGTPSGFGP